MEMLGNQSRFDLSLNGIPIGKLENLVQGAVYRIIIQKALNDTDGDYVNE